VVVDPVILDYLSVMPVQTKHDGNGVITIIGMLCLDSLSAGDIFDSQLLNSLDLWGSCITFEFVIWQSAW